LLFILYQLTNLQPAGAGEPQETPTPDPDENEEEEQFDEDYHEGDEDVMDIEEDDVYKPEPQHLMPPPPARGRTLGKFMTPQAPRHVDFGLPRSKSRGHVRYSIGRFTPGGIHGTGEEPIAGPSTASGPRRVRVVEPWKVQDITVPLRDQGESGEQEREKETETERDRDMGGWLATPGRGVPTSPSKREKLSEEERKVKFSLNMQHIVSVYSSGYSTGHHPATQVCPHRA
jgi:hypothetical protein